MWLGACGGVNAVGARATLALHFACSNELLLRACAPETSRVKVKHRSAAAAIHSAELLRSLHLPDRGPLSLLSRALRAVLPDVNEAEGLAVIIPAVEKEEARTQ
jgi:hypothetical protein